MIEILESVFFYFVWCLIFIACYYVSKFQFKWCIPVCLELVKIVYALSMVLLIRLYYLLRIENMVINWDQIMNDSRMWLQNLTKLEL